MSSRVFPRFFSSKYWKRNTWIRSETKVTDVIKRVGKLKWVWVGHVARRTDEKCTVEILYWYLRSIARPWGRPLIRWADALKGPNPCNGLTDAQNDHDDDEVK